MSARKAKSRRAAVRVADLEQAVEGLAPRAYAQSWDNVGLLAGDPAWEVRSALVALDLTDDVAREALRKKVDALVLYHPPIFKGIRRVTSEAACPTSLLAALLAERVALLALHTALDAAVGGTNDVLLDCFEPVERRPLEPMREEGRSYKLVVFVPPAEAGALRRALSAAGAGVIGHYSECSFEIPGRGTFKGDASTNPTVGQRQRLEYAEELRLEMVVPRRRLDAVIAALYRSHSYEEPAFDLYPLDEVVERGRVGMGRVGRLARATPGTALVEMLGRRADLSCAQVVGSLKRRFRSVTAAAGAFGVDAFRDQDSLVITGEFKHHDALALRKRGVTAIHLGHYASEQPVLRVVREGVARRVPGCKVSLARADRGPFTALNT